MTFSWMVFIFISGPDPEGFEMPFLSQGIKKREGGGQNPPLRPQGVQEARGRFVVGLL